MAIFCRAARKTVRKLLVLPVPTPNAYCRNPFAKMSINWQLINRVILFYVSNFELKRVQAAIEQ